MSCVRTFETRAKITFLPEFLVLTSSSLILCPLFLQNFLNLEYQNWFVDDLRSVFTYHFENSAYEFCTTQAVCFRWTLTFCLLVEEPFVNFDPLQSCLLDSLHTSFTVHVAAVLLVDCFQDNELVLRLVLAEWEPIFLPALIAMHFSKSFTRNCRPRPSLRRIFSDL